MVSCCTVAGDYQASLNAFDTVVQSDAEKTSEMWNNHGSVLHMLGQFGRAIESYSEALRLDESYELARINRAFAYRDLGAYEAAVGDFSVVLDNKPGWAELYLLRGNVLERIDSGSTLAGESYLQFMTRAGTVLKASGRSPITSISRPWICAATSFSSFMFMFVTVTNWTFR